MSDYPINLSLPDWEPNLEQKVGQLFMPAVFINDTEAEIRKMEVLIRELCIGSLCFFHSRASAATNFEGSKKIIYNENSLDRLKDLIARYQEAAEIPLLIAMDAEWGLAMRIENTPQYPYALTLGALGDDSLVEEVGRAMGRDCQGAGIHWNLAPVVDINNNPQNPVIGYRSFGDGREGVFTKSRALVKGMSATGTLSSIKHFPGHGDTAVDSHLGLPVIDKSLEELVENELYPFHQHIKKGVDAVMVGHLSLPQLDAAWPSTTSQKIVTGLLREQMGFGGVVISDALNMHAVSKSFPEKGQLEAKCFEAGMDVLCFSENPREGIQKILETSRAHRIEESFGRLWALKEKVFSTKSPVETPTPDLSPLQRRLAQGSITQLYGNPTLVESIKREGFLNIALNNDKENLFSKGLEREYSQKALDLVGDMEAIQASLGDFGHIVLAVFPPSANPKDHFGMDPKALETLRDWMGKKNVLIYFFGNPYALELLGLNHASNVVLGYQDFPEFQEVALEHFRGTHTAVGRLPIKLKSIQG